MMMIMIRYCLILSLIFQPVGATGHFYSVGDSIDLWTIKVGPSNYPQERYDYYSLPFCAPSNGDHPSKTGQFNKLKPPTLGESLSGVVLRHSGHNVSFLTESTEECTTMPLDRNQADQFRNAVENTWFYQFLIDDLPVSGMIGEMLPARVISTGEGVDFHNVSNNPDRNKMYPYIFSDRTLTIFTNTEGQILRADLAAHSRSLKELKEGERYTFQLNVTWRMEDTLYETGLEFASRYDRYGDHESLVQLWNAGFMNVMILLLLVNFILKLRKAMKKGLQDDEDEDTLSESPRTHIQNDVVRTPSHLPLLAACVGSGCHLALTILGVIVFSLLSRKPDSSSVREGCWPAIFVCSTLTSMTSGFVAGKLAQIYDPSTDQRTGLPRVDVNAESGFDLSLKEDEALPSQSSEPVGDDRDHPFVSDLSDDLLPKPKPSSPALDNSSSFTRNRVWWKTIGLTMVLLPSLNIFTLLILSTLSSIQGTQHTLNLSVFVKLVLSWMFASAPLSLLGAWVGSLCAGMSSGDRAIRNSLVAPVPRPIPTDLPWQSPILIAGFVNFLAITYALQRIFRSFWVHTFYTGFLYLLVNFITAMVTVSATSVLVVYYSLKVGNYNWTWTAFGSGAVTFVYVLLYGLYVWCSALMSGFFQTVSYFVVLVWVAALVGVLFGSVAFGAAHRFVAVLFQHKSV